MSGRCFFIRNKIHVRESEIKVKISKNSQDLSLARELMSVFYHFPGALFSRQVGWVRQRYYLSETASKWRVSIIRVDWV